MCTRASAPVWDFSSAEASSRSEGGGDGRDVVGSDVGLPGPGEGAGVVGLGDGAGVGRAHWLS